MNTFVALFRGINVGGKNILLMKDLVGILAALGHEDVKTYIQSGNVVFSNRKAINAEEISRISDDIHRQNGFEPKILVMPLSQLLAAIKLNPYPIDNGKILHFFFLASTPQHPDMEKIDALKAETESCKLTGNVFYLYAPDGIGRSKLAAAAEKLLGVPTTARNWNTVSKLLAMADST